MRGNGRGKILTLLVLFFLTQACSKVDKSRNLPKSVSKETFTKLTSQAEDEKKSIDIKVNKNEGYIVSTSSEDFGDVLKNIESHGGKVVDASSDIGYIFFTGKATDALSVIRTSGDEIESFNFNEELNLEEFSADSSSTNDVDRRVEQDKIDYSKLDPSTIMKSRKLIEQFQAEGIKLDGSSSTVAVFDTGLDITRTDAFQDRIVYLRSIRKQDNALVTEAEMVTEDGVDYLESTINGKTIRIERTEKLQSERTYYLGYFTEEQFKTNARYKTYDFNQDGEDKGIFPIVVFKNDNGIFESYINVNDKLNYENGDSSIEDENKLHGFNWVSDNFSGKKRFVENKDEPVKSHYKFTTRMDVASNGNITTSRSGGYVDLAITLEPGFELTADGSELAKAPESSEDQVLHRVGITGIDVNGHGTHCAGIAAGDFKTAKEFNAATTKSKIIGISFLGGGARTSDLIAMIEKLAKKYPNIVFSFSFGSNSANNDTQSQLAQIYDKLAMKYNVPIVKSAGNEGPGLNSHGITTSRYTLSVANFHSTNAKRAYSYGTFMADKFFVSPSSSRGPMVDGAIKPDIGAPGWVMSTTPLAAPLGGKKSSFAFWSGTSMAAPNVAGVIALLYDAAEKSGLGKGVPGRPAILIDKVSKAIKNSALPYDEFPYAEAKQFLGEDSNVLLPSVGEVKDYEFSWLDGGAGRINAEGAWNIIKDINKDKSLFFKINTKSHISSYNTSPDKNAVGYFIINDVKESTTIKVGFDFGGVQDPSNSVFNKDYILEIPKDIKWLSFDQYFKEDSKITNKRIINLKGTEELESFRLFFNKKILANEKGYLKPGLHHAMIKAYPKTSSGEAAKNFDFVIPVTLVGYDTQFERRNDGLRFSANGFIPAEHTRSFYIPVNQDNASLVLDLEANDTIPGILKMSVYYNGLELPRDVLGSKSSWVISGNNNGIKRENVVYTLRDMPKGLYEVVVKADSTTNYTCNSYCNNNDKLNGILGSHFKFSAYQLSLEGKGKYFTSGADHIVELKNFKNNGAQLVLSSARVYTNSLIKNDEVKVEHKKVTEYKFSVPAGIQNVKINSYEVESLPGTDIDIVLKDSTGKIIGNSGKQNSDEEISVSNLTEGEYTVELIGYDIPCADGAEACAVREDYFGLSIELQTYSEVELTSKLHSAKKGKDLGYNFRWYEGEELTIKGKFSAEKLKGIVSVDGYVPVINTEIKAFTDNFNKEIIIYKESFHK